MGSLKEDIIEAETGFVCRARDPIALSEALERYFKSKSCLALESRRPEIRRFASERYSWTTVAGITKSVYNSFAARA